MEPLSILSVIAALFIGHYTADYVSEMRDREKWAPQEHRTMMRECRRMCGKNQVGKYSPIELCSCSKRKRGEQ